MRSRSAAAARWGWAGAACLLGLLAVATPLVLTAPPSVAGTYLHAPAAFGADLPTSVSGRVVWAQPRDACRPITNAAQVRSSIALATRSPPGATHRCDFAAKVRALQAAGARLVVIVNHDGRAGVDDANELVTMTAVDAAKDIKIPAVFVVRRI
jgi:hypothetical protein